MPSHLDKQGILDRVPQPNQSVDRARIQNELQHQQTIRDGLEARHPDSLYYASGAYKSVSQQRESALRQLENTDDKKQAFLLGSVDATEYRARKKDKVFYLEASNSAKEILACVSLMDPNTQAWVEGLRARLETMANHDLNDPAVLNAVIQDLDGAGKKPDVHGSTGLYNLILAWQRIKNIYPRLGEAKDPTFKLEEFEQLGKNSISLKSGNLKENQTERYAMMKMVQGERTPIPKEPEVRTPIPKEPEVRTPIPKEPEVRTPIPKEPEVRTPIPKEPEVRTPIPKEPEVRTPIPKEPEVRTPIPKEPEVRTPIPKEPEVRTPIPKEPEVRTPIPKEPEVRTPIPKEPEVSTPIPKEPEVSTPIPKKLEADTPLQTAPEVGTSIPDVPRAYTQITKSPEMDTSIPTIPKVTTPFPKVPEAGAPASRPPEVKSSPTVPPISTTEIPSKEGRVVITPIPPAPQASSQPVSPPEATVLMPPSVTTGPHPATSFIEQVVAAGTPSAVSAVPVSPSTAPSTLIDRIGKFGKEFLKKSTPSEATKSEKKLQDFINTQPKDTEKIKAILEETVSAYKNDQAKLPDESPERSELTAKINELNNFKEKVQNAERIKGEIQKYKPSLKVDIKLVDNKGKNGSTYDLVLTLIGSEAGTPINAMVTITKDGKLGSYFQSGKTRQTVKFEKSDTTEQSIDKMLNSLV